MNGLVFRDRAWRLAGDTGPRTAVASLLPPAGGGPAWTLHRAGEAGLLVAPGANATNEGQGMPAPAGDPATALALGPAHVVAGTLAERGSGRLAAVCGSGPPAALARAWLVHQGWTVVELAAATPASLDLLADVSEDRAAWLAGLPKVRELGVVQLFVGRDEPPGAVNFYDQIHRCSLELRAADWHAPGSAACWPADLPDPLRAAMGDCVPARLNEPADPRRWSVLAW